MLDILRRIREALYMEDDYKNMPDFGVVLERIMMTADDDPLDILDALENEIAAMETEGEPNV